jgi:hypothetical protein
VEVREKSVDMGRVWGCILLSCSQIQTHKVQSYGRVKEDTSPVGVDLTQKTKDLSVSEREECGHGKGVGVYVMKDEKLICC